MGVNVMIEYSLHNTGVVRPIARAGHWRWVSIPSIGSAAVERGIEIV
jgi:hypothetical protein